MTRVHNTYQYMVGIFVIILAVVALAFGVLPTAYAQQDGQKSLSEEEKIPVPTLDKKVLNLSDEWVYSRTALSGEDCQFKLTVVLGEDFDKLDKYDVLDTYNITIIDEPPAGLAVDYTSVKATLDGKDILSKVTEDKDTFSIDVGDVKVLGAKPNSVIEVTYTAHIADGAAHIGFPGYVNRAYAVYPKGQTEKAEASLVTLVISINKTDMSSSKSLSGAKFAIRTEAGLMLHKDGSWTDTYDENTCLFETNSQGICEFKGLSDGKYEIVEAVAPDGYKRANVMIGAELVADLSKKSVTVSAVHDLVKSVSADSASNTTITFGNEEGSSNPEPSKPFDNSKKPELGKTGYRMPVELLAVAIAFLVLGVIGIASDCRRRRADN